MPGSRWSPRPCPVCRAPLRFEVLDEERLLVAWTCLDCGWASTTEPG